MKKYILPFIAFGSALVTGGLHAQFSPCDISIYPWGWPSPFPFYCTGDTVKFSIYNPGMGFQYDSLIIHWGDGTSEGVSINYIQGILQHVYDNPGVYFPYFEGSGGNCGDTLLPFQASGYPIPGDSTQFATLNFIVVSDACIPVSGRAFIDTDGDCVFSPGDVPLTNRAVSVLFNSIVSYTVFTDSLGYFSFNGPPGVTFQMNSSQVGSSMTAVCGTSTSGSNLVANAGNDFVFNCNGGLDVSISSGVSVLAQTVFSPVFFNVCNEGCTAVNNPTVTFQFPNQVIPQNPGSVSVYINGNWTGIIPTVSGSSVSFTIPATLTPQTCIIGYLYAQANPQNTTLGTEVCFTFLVDPTTGDVNPSNNTSNACATVVTSYDPNDKQGQSDNKNAHGEIEANKPITYTIRFQNEGNFPARDVRITDTLDVNLDWNSVEILGSSHLLQVWQNDNVLTFFFDEIWLPTISMNEAASQGFVVFQVKQDPNLPPLTQIKNNADIFFDYNPPVRTNTVVSVIKAVGLADHEGLNVRLVPNPVVDHLNVVGEIGGPCEIRLIDGAGRTALNQIISNTGQTISVKELKNGVYTAHIRVGDKIKGVQKVVILR
ncbi:MAG: T9SS type A sorting domain-containing protein [Chitinophagales bacterium]|nr:T9SS type A sorting domain-containing protein [Chitinophagales bacterium]